MSDRILAKNDGDLPGLALVLDSDALAGRVSAARGALTATYVRYRIGRSCMVSFNRGDMPWGYAVALDAARYRRARARAATHVDLWLDDTAVMVSFFPSDGELAALADLVDPEACAALIGRLNGAPPLAGPLRITTLRYKPERRYVATVNGANGGPLLLKALDRRDYPRAVAAYGRAAASGLNAQRLLAADDEDRVMLLGWVPGETLLASLAGSQPDLKVVHAAGRTVARLHAVDPAGLAPVGDKRDVATLNVRARGLAIAGADTADRAVALVDRIAAHLDSRDTPPYFVHGDLKADQLIATGDDVALIDLDAAGSGDPFDDLSKFAASLEFEALAGRIMPETARAARAVFLNGYQAAGGSPVPDWFESYTAATLLRLAQQPFRAREAGWAEKTGAIVARAEQIVADQTG